MQAGSSHASPARGSLTAPRQVTGELQYKSALDCVGKIMAEGGPLRFYAGFPTCARTQ